MGYFKWINCNKSIINDVGLGFIDVKYISKINLFKSGIMKLQVHQEVNSKVNLKKTFGLEKYFLKLPEQKRIWISKLITCNLGIPIETERWHNIPRHE